MRLDAGAPMLDEGAPTRRAPGWPLVVTLGAHLLLGWWWLNATPARWLPSSVPALREFFVLVVPPPQRAAQRPAAAPATTSAPAPAPAVPVARPAAPQPITAPAITAPPPLAAPIAPDTASDTETGLPETPAVSETAAAQRDVLRGGTGLAGQARRAAGAADHDLRDGKSAPLAPGDSKWARFESAVASARVDTSKTLITETYTSPDGTVVYRFRQNGKTWCRTGGSVGPSMFGAVGGGQVLFDKAGGGGSAGTIECPKGAEFKRD